MKLLVERAALLKALNHIQSVVERRNTIPILANVRLDAAENVLRLKGTDLDLELSEEIDATVSGAGATTVAAHTLFEIVRKLPDGAEIELSVQGDNILFLRAGRSRFTLPTLQADDFPEMSRGAYSVTFGLSATDLTGLIDRTRFAVSSEETRYYLNGIYLHVAQDNGRTVLRSVATDGHRLALIQVDAPEGSEKMPGVIIPRKAVNEVRRLLDEEQQITLSLSETRVSFTIGKAVLTSKLVDGTFPDYQRVIPVGNNRCLVVDCKGLAQAVDRVTAISVEKSRAVRVSVSQENLTLSASTPEAGSATEEMEVRFDKAGIDIGFNSRYLLDILERIQGTSVRFDLADSASPAIVREVEDNSALYVLMPMRV